MRPSAMCVCTECVWGAGVSVHVTRVRRGHARVHVCAVCVASRRTHLWGVGCTSVCVCTCTCRAPHGRPQHEGLTTGTLSPPLRLCPSLRVSLVVTWMTVSGGLARLWELCNALHGQPPAWQRGAQRQRGPSSYLETQRELVATAGTGSNFS